MNRLSILLLTSYLIIFFAKGDEGSTAGGEKRVVCYYTGMMSQFGPAPEPEDIDPTLCTHLVYTIAKMDNETYRLAPSYPNVTLYENGGKGYLNRTAKLKELNPGMKILLHVLRDSYVYDVPPTASGISNFTESAVELLSSYGFDGLHFGWSKPEVDNVWLLSQFLTELRKEFDKHNFLISAFFQQYDTLAYEDQDLEVIKSTCDFIVLGTFEYVDRPPKVTFIFSPLESVKSTVDMHLAKEFPADKLLISIISNAVSLKLKDINENGVGAELELAEDGLPIERLYYYSKIMQNIKDGNWTAFRDEKTNAPYATSNDGHWISYDDPTYIRMKAEYVVEKNLGGAAIFRLDFDDFNGSAGGGRYPLTRALHDVMVRGHEIES